MSAIHTFATATICTILCHSPLTAQDEPAQAPVWTGVLDEADFAALHELDTSAVPPLHGVMIPLGDGEAYLSMPASGSAEAAVLVIHEWWGLNQHIKHWTDRLAADGYAALAVDLYRGKVAGTRDEAMAAMRAVEDGQALSTLQAAYEFLRSDPRVAAHKVASIGWCFGGGWSLRLALAEPGLDAAVMYYGRVVTDPAALAPVRAPVLAVFGNLDTSLPPAMVDEFEAAMKQAGRQIEVLRYDANHAFANPSSARYDQAHAAAAWAEVRRFLQARLARVATESSTFDLGGHSVTCTVPAGWQVAAARPMRAISFTLGPNTECYVMSLPGTGGGTDANLNRWRTQLGQPPLSAAEIQALPRIPMLGTEAVLAHITGSFQPQSGSRIEDAAMFGAVALTDDQAVFVKLTGPRVEVDAQAGAFRSFCASLRE